MLSIGTEDKADSFGGIFGSKLREYELTEEEPSFMVKKEMSSFGKIYAICTGH